jgi:EpsD family peptidyl-prolyl cis-trans isomerase
MTFASNRFTLSLLAAALTLGLAACGDKGDKGDKKAATQVAAKVGSEEISVHQINQVLQRANTNGASPEAAKAMGREVLEKLIDQQLAVDQAVEAKLHRSPDVVTQIEAARREILARAYMQKLASGLPKPTPEEIKAYYKDQPALFSERRIYNLQELVVPKTPANAGANLTAELKAQVAAGKSMEDSAGWLKSKDIQFGGGRATRPAEQIPLELLSQLHALKDGQSMVFETPQATTLVRVVSSQQAPVPEADALPRIEQFITNRRATDAVAADLKKLRAATSVAYMGEFSAPDAAAATAAPAAAPAAVSVPKAAEVQADPARAAIEKGVSGLK